MSDYFKSSKNSLNDSLIERRDNRDNKSNLDNGSNQDKYQRPLYYGKNSNIADMVSDELYFGFREIKNNIVDSVKKSYYSSKDLMIKAKNVNRSIVAGTAVGAVLNGYIIHYASKHNISSSQIKWISICAEAVVNTLVLAPIFIYGSMKDGNTFKKSVKELAFNIFPIAFPLSFGPYRIAKNFTADIFMGWGAPAEVALPSAQIFLTPFFMGAVDYFLEKFKYFKDNPGTLKTEIKQSIQNGKDKITGVVKNGIDNFKNDTKNSNNNNDISDIL